MSPQLTPSNPAEVMVIRDLSPTIVTLSVPFARFGVFKIGGRATIIKLASGALVVFSPVALTDDVRAKVASLGGNVAYIVAPDTEHHLFVTQWKAAYPSAVLIGPAGLPEKRAKLASKNDGTVPPDERWDVVFRADSKRQTRVTDEFDAEFDYEFVDGHANQEIVLFYKPGRVLVQADLFFSLPATEQYSRVPEQERGMDGLADRLFTALQTTQGELKWPRRWLWYIASAKDRASFNESARRIDGWDFEAVVPCHGDVLENGKQAFRRLFQWHLQDQ